MNWQWARYVSEDGYEVSSIGDTRFSALYAKLADGRTIEEAYQLDVKGYRKAGYTNWRQVKGRRPRVSGDVWPAYLDLWRQWARENPELIEALRVCAAGCTLTDKFAKTQVSQARALAHLLNERPSWMQQEFLNL
jgi:hypothetical protein